MSTIEKLLVVPAGQPSGQVAVADVDRTNNLRPHLLHGIKLTTETRSASGHGLSTTLVFHIRICRDRATKVRHTAASRLPTAPARSYLIACACSDGPIDVVRQTRSR